MVAPGHLIFASCAHLKITEELQMFVKNDVNAKYAINYTKI